MTSKEQRQLVRQWQQGDDAAKEKLVSYAYTIIMRVLLPSVSSPRIQCQDVEDIIQETFLIACEKVESKEFDPEKSGSFTSYCVAIGLNLIKRLLHKKDPFISGEDLWQYFFDTKESDPSEVLESLETLQILNRCLHQLEPLEFDVVCLFFGLPRGKGFPDKLNFKEIDLEHKRGHGWASRKFTKALIKLSKCISMNS